MFFQETHIFPSGGEVNYRIPSLVVTNNGTVLAFCTNRVGSLKDYADEIDLVCAIKRPDGSILYNSRAYFNDGKRYLAVSRDGGASYGEFAKDGFLLEEKKMGCNASFLRVELEDISDKACLPRDAADVTVFCNPRAETRTRMAACVSFDSGAHYVEARVIFDGPAAYSSLDFDKQSGHFFLLYERGDAAKGRSPYTEGLYVAEFDLEWLLSHTV